MADSRKRTRDVPNADRLSAIVLAVFGLFVLYEASELRFGSLTRPGSGFLPTTLAILLIVLSLLLVAQTFRAKASPHAARFGDRLDHVVITLVAMVAYGALLEQVGFPILTVALLLLMLRGLGRVSWRMTFVLAILGTSITFVLFRELGIPLPMGPMPL